MHFSMSLPVTHGVCGASTRPPVQNRVSGTDAWFSEAA